jgi:hypothetical protein
MNGEFDDQITSKQSFTTSGVLMCYVRYNIGAELQKNNTWDSNVSSDVLSEVY